MEEKKTKKKKPKNLKELEILIDKNEKLMSREELATATGLEMSFIEKAKKKYGLPSYKIGGLVKYTLADYYLWKAQRKQVS